MHSNLKKSIDEKKDLFNSNSAKNPEKGETKQELRRRKAIQEKDRKNLLEYLSGAIDEEAPTRDIFDKELYMPFLWKKALMHSRFGEFKKYFIGSRGSYVFEDLILKKRVLERNLSMLELLTYTNHIFMILSEYPEGLYIPKQADSEQDRKRRFLYKNMWLQGHLFRHFSDTLSEERRERHRMGLDPIVDDENITRYFLFPNCMISLSNIERVIAIKEARKVNMPTFSFSNYNREEFIKSEYKYSMNQENEIHVRMIHMLVYLAIMHRRILSTRIIHTSLRNILDKLSTRKRKLERKLNIFRRREKTRNKRISEMFQELFRELRPRTKFFKLNRRKKIKWFLKNPRRYIKRIIRTPKMRRIYRKNVHYRT